MRYLLITLAFISSIAFSEIYKWTDESGQVHFGDSPADKDNAEKVSVEINSYKSVSIGTVQVDQKQKEESSKSVIMYATSWCGYCKKAREYFQQNNIDYVEYDIEKDERAKRRYDELGGRGVPVILVGDQRMNGFSVAGFERIYQ